MAKQLNVSLAFTADTSKAKAELQDLQRQLTQLTNAPVSNSGKGFFLTKEIQEATVAAADLRIKLQQATDVNTGKLDLNKFDQSLKNSGTSLKTYREALSNLGPAGDKAFAALASSIMKADVPLRTTNKLLNEFKTTLMNTARWQISSSILHGFMGTLQSAYGYAQDLNQSLNNIRIVTGYSNDEMAKFAESANKAAQSLSTTTTKYTDAALIYYQQGIRDEEEIADRTETTIKLANVSRQSAEEVSSQMTAIWNNFDNGSHSLEYYADVITALGANTASSSQEIAKGMQQFAAVADTVGLSYEYAAASLATIVATTRQSESTVGNGLRTIFSRLEGLKLGETLEDGTDLNKYSAALATIGVNIKDTTGNLKDMDTILEETASKWDTLDKAQKVAFATTVGGVRQYTNLIALLDNWDMVQENIGIAKNSEGTLQEQADIYAESWEAAQKRVRAAAEEIYQELLNDDFFITLLNGFKEVLDIINNTIDAIGGLKGVLIAVGAIVTNLFQREIASEINRIGQNIRIATGQAAQATTARKAEAAQEMQQMTANSADENTGNAMFVAYTQQGQLQQELINNASRLSDERKKELQILLDINAAQGESVIKMAEAADQAARELQLEEKRILLKTKDVSIKSDVNVFGEEMRSFGQLSAAASGLKAAFQDASVEGNKITVSLEQASSCLDRLKGLNFDDATADAQEIDSLLLKLQLTLESMESASGDTLEGLKADAIEISDKLDQLATKAANTKIQSGKNISSEDAKAIENYGIKAFETGQKVERSAQSIDQLGQSGKQASKEIQQGGTNFSNFGKQATATAAAVTTTIMVINNLTNAIKTLTNPDLSVFEKITGILGSIAMTVPMVISTISQLTLAFGSVGAAATAAWTAITGPIGIAIAGVTAAVVGLYLAWENFTPEGKLAKAKKEAEEAKKSYDEAKKAVNEFKSEYKDWSSLYAKTQELTEGTQEYIDAMREANEEAMALIQKYNLLEGKDWHFDENGNFVIDSDHKEKENQLEQDKTYLGELKANSKTNNTKSDIQISQTYSDQSNLMYAGTSHRKEHILSQSDIKNLATQYANGEINSPEQLSELVDKGIQKFEDKHSRVDENGNKVVQKGYDVSDKQAQGLVSAIIELSGAISEFSSQNKNNDRQAELTSARIKLNEGGKYEFGMEPYLNKYYQKKQGYDSVTGEKFEYDNADQIAAQYKKVTELMSSISSEDIDDETKQKVSHALLEAILSGKTPDFSDIDTSGWSDTLIAKFGDLADEVQAGINDAATHIDSEKIAQNFQDINSIIKELGDGNSISADSYNKLTKAQQAYFKDMGDGTYQLIGEAKDFINAIKGNALSDSVDALQKLRSQEATVNRISDKTGEKESYLWDKDYQTSGEFTKIRASHQVDALSSVGADTSQWDEKISSGTMTADDYAKLTEEVYKYKDALLALANSGQDFGASQQTILNGWATEATSLYELQGFMQTLNGNYEAYSVGLMNLASQYDNCEQELKEYQEALASQDETAVQAAESALQQAIIVGEASKKYNLNAKTVETQAKQLEKAYDLSSDAAARLAVANERMNRGVATLNKNWSSWGKTLKSTDHTSQKYAEALNEATDALADLTGTADAATIPVDFLDSSTKSGAQHLKWMEEAAKGNEQAINQLGVALGAASVEAMEFNDQMAQAAIDSGLLKMPFEEAKNSFDSWQNEVMEGINNLADAVANGTIQAGENIAQLMDGTGENWVNSLNAMAAATGMSVEQMNSLLNQLGVQAKVEVKNVEQDMEVPTYVDVVEGTTPVKIAAGVNEDGSTKYTEVQGYRRYTVPGAPITVRGNVQVAQISTEGNTGVGSPPITYTGTGGSKAGGVSKPAGKGGGGGGGGGGSSKPAKKKDVTKKNDEKEIDRYIKINQELAQKEHESNLLKTKLDSTSGQTAIKVMKEQLNILKQQKGLYGELAKEAENYRVKDLEKLKQDFADLSFQIDPSDGMLMNYEALLKEQTDLYNKVYNEWTEKIIAAEKEYNAQIEILGEAATEEALKPWAEAIEKLKEESKDPLREAEERYELFKKDTDKYNDSVEQARKAAEEAAAKELEAYNQELEIIAKGVELKIKIDDADLQYLEFLLKQIGEGADRALDRMSNYTQSLTDNMNKIEKYQEGLGEVLDHAGIDFDELLNGDIDDLGSFNEEDLAKVEEYRDGLISCGEQLLELRETLLNEVRDAFDEFNSDLDRSIEKIEHLKSFTETYKNLIDIVGKRVLDPLGKTTLMLARTTYTQAESNTKALKSQLDYQLSVIEDYNRVISDLESKNDNGQHDDTIKEFKDQLKEAEDAYASTQESWLSSWEETVQAAADIYEAELNQILEDFSNSISGMMRSLDDLSEEYSRIQTIQDIYVDDYEKIYQLSKLNRDINKSLDDSTTLASKAKLRDIQKEINDLQESGVEVSQYDLDVLQKKYEMALAYEQWQDAQNAKTVVRMQRDNEGNYGYVYTADQADVEAAEQNYEDKLHEMQVLNAEYIQSLQEQIIQAQQDCADALANLRAQDFASYEEYQDAVEQIRKDYTKRIETLSQQMGNAMDNNRTLYEQDWTAYHEATGYKISADENYIDKFNETVYSQLTGFQTMEEAQNAFVSAVNDAADLAAQNWEDWYIRTNSALDLGGNSMQNYTEEVDEAINGSGGLVEQTQDAEDAVHEMANEYDTAFTEIIDYAWDFADDFDSVIQNIIEGCNNAIEAIMRLLEAMAELEGEDDDDDDSSPMQANDYKWKNLKEGTGEYEWVYENSQGNRKKGTFSADWTTEEGEHYWADYDTDENGIVQASPENFLHNGYFGSYNKRTSQYGEVLPAEVIPMGNNDYELETGNVVVISRNTDVQSKNTSSGPASDTSFDDLVNYYGPGSFDTGGYTGDWGSSKKMAFLHEKELVLNADDTENILSAVDMIRSISKTIDLNALAAGSIFASPNSAYKSSFGSRDSLEQNVHIQAEFPNVSDHNEIEEALNNLIERAAQFAGRKNL